MCDLNYCVNMYVCLYILINVCVCIYIHHMYVMRTLAHSVRGIMDETRQIHTDYRNPVEEKG